MYEPNLANTYALVRSGKYIKTVQDKYGQTAGGIISNLLLLGHVRVSDLAQAYQPAEDSKGPLNGALMFPNHSLPQGSVAEPSSNLKGNHGPSTESLHKALYNLMRAGLISAVNESHFRSAADNRSEAEKEIPLKDRYVGKLKKEHEAEREQAIEQKLKDWQYGKKVEREELGGLRKLKKRQLEDPEDAPQAKRQQFHSSSVTNGIIEGAQFHSQVTSEIQFLNVCYTPSRVSFHLM